MVNLENLPEIVSKNEKVPNKTSQIATGIRELMRLGNANQEQINWLYDFEAQHPPPGGRTFTRLYEESTQRRLLETGTTTSAADGAQVSAAEGKRLDRVLEAVAESIQELRLGFTNVLGELRSGAMQINQGYEQLQADTRSFLGVLFPHMEKMMEQQTESMSAYRKAVLSEAKAEASIVAANAAAAQGDGASSEAEKAVIGLLLEGAKQKMGLDPTKKPDPKKTP